MQGQRRNRTGLIVASAIAACVLFGVAWWRFGTNNAVERGTAATTPNASAPTLDFAPAPSDTERFEQPDSQTDATHATDSPNYARLEAFWGTLHSFWVRVLDEDGDAPIADATSYLLVDSYAHHSDLTSEQKLPAVKSDARGFIELRFPAYDGVQACLRASGFTEVTFRIDESHATEKLALVVHLRHAAEIEVRARDASNTPVAHARLSVVADRIGISTPHEASFHDAFESWRAETDEQGVASLADMPVEVPLTVELAANANYIATSFDDVVLARGEKRVIVLRLGGNSRITGILLDEMNEPVSGQKLWLTNQGFGQEWNMVDRRFFCANEARRVNWVTTTDEHGRFAITDVPCGHWWIGPAASVQHSGEKPEFGERDVCAVATPIDVDGRSALEVTLRTQRGLFITARVLGPNGELPPASVVARADGDPCGIVLGVQIPDDEYAVGPLIAGRYFLQAHSLGEACNSEELCVDANARNVELRLRQGGSVRGTTIDALTRVACPCTIHVGSERSGESDGSFAITRIPPGIYDLCATTLDGRYGLVRNVAIAAGKQTDAVEISLVLAARLHVRYSGTRKYAHVAVYQDGALVVSEGGLHRQLTATHTVPAGNLRIEMRVDSSPPQTREVTIAAGEERTVDFKFD